MTSRLDRLYVLLDSGSSAVTRQTAAKQIGEIQKLYPHELHNLLNRLIGYLHSSSWDTRIAAAQAVEAVLKNVPQWKPPASDENSEEKCLNSESELISFNNFNLSQVLHKGARLMGSEGNEFDVQPNDGPNDRLSRQRALLNENLGLTQASKLGINLSEMITDDDMQNDCVNININEQKVPVEHILKITLHNKLTTSENNIVLSCREVNRAKRKARQNNSSTPSSSNGPEVSEKKKSKGEGFDKFETFYDINAPVPDVTGVWSDTTTWPLEQFSSKMFLDLFNPRWEVRHGSASALRALLNTHSSGAGKTVFMTNKDMENSHNLWLEDAALRLLCVLSLDRFGDFVSDQVVAPVRETCAQVLGTIVKEMPTDKVENTVQVLLKLIKQTEWEVRHGGLLGLKYIFVVREDLLHLFLPLTINDILMGLFDPVDDVGAVAASTLTPVASWLPTLLNSNQVSSIVKMLWDLLLDQDELTSACNSFMGLLASILCLPASSEWIQMEPMTVLLPRLWPFLRHNSSSVRRSTLQTLKTLSTNYGIRASNNIADSHSNNDVQIIRFDSKNLKPNFGVIEWQAPLLQEALRHVFQRILVESLVDIQEQSKDVWMNLIKNANLTSLLHAACPFVSSWICLAMQPAKLAFDPTILIYATRNVISDKRKSIRACELGDSADIYQKFYLGGNESTPADVRERNVIRARINSARILGLLSCYLVQPAPGVEYNEQVETPVDCYTKVLMGHLQSKSANQRLVCSLVISFWALSDPTICPGPIGLQERLHSCVTEYVYYDEVAISFTRLHQSAQEFITILKQHNISVFATFFDSKVMTLNQIEQLSSTVTDNLKSLYPNLKPKIYEMIEDKRRCLYNSFLHTHAEQNCYNVSTQAALAGAIVCLRCLPDKLNPVIKPLMESLKREDSELLQQLSAQFLVQLLDKIANRTPNPNNKIFLNLCALLKSDSEFTPQINCPKMSLNEFKPDQNEPNSFYGILTLEGQQKSQSSQSGCGAPSTSRCRGRPVVSDISLDEILKTDDSAAKSVRIQRIGAMYAVEEICSHFGSQLRNKMPILWEVMFTNISNIVDDENILDMLSSKVINAEKTNDLLTALQLIEVAVSKIHSSLHPDMFDMLPKLGLLLKHPLKHIRHMVSRCIATLGTVNLSTVMNFVVRNVLKLLESIENVIWRQGATEAIARLVQKLQLQMVPYAVILVIPLLGRMSDNDECVRLMSTHTFATLIQLMPLDSSQVATSSRSDILQLQKARDREFLNCLFDPKTIPDFKVPVKVKAELRNYQQSGVNWMWFLNKYNLHGILCDDMGLGKTLQTICILAGDHHQRAVSNESHIPSLVICPPTLTGHWVYEVEKFISSEFFSVLHYVGLPGGREKLKSEVNNNNLVITSYDIVRKDIAFFSSLCWNYCVLDEGHIIKNGKTKNSRAIKQLRANHRLILSGTPIQNNVLELWSLFDFLMPGFLGTEKQFLSRYSRPILASRDPKSTPKEQESGVLAMESLHRQILPFLLRRVKEDVLMDLPPKITQDLLCELSPLQQRLYEDFSQTHLNSEIKDCIESLGESENLGKKTHIFQALRYLQNVCNHPKLVLTQNHPEFELILKDLTQKNTCLDDIEHSAKLPVLKQLLLDCGIGVENESVSPHRALIFCQLKAMLDIVEKDLLKKHLTVVTYLRLDGSVPASNRQDIVRKFNSDPSIDVLLLTTQVGGLGLNLTGADTVIFVEHDWNPMKDLQAMDRAHRIGQKKIVNVYRLITQKSLEEKIMGLQKFKILTANTVVNSENAAMETMGTAQLFDLFSASNNDSQNREQNSASTSSKNNSMKNVIESLPQLWAESQYDEEYDLSQFVERLKNSHH